MSAADHSAPPTAPNAYDLHGQATTRRGIATVSFSFALWGLLVFWWYPYGLCIATMGVILGAVSWALGIRAGKDGENLALGGVLIGSCAVGAALMAHRFMQVYFEGTSVLVP
jgi:hypothetical protein